jgi:hypothetical protein
VSLHDQLISRWLVAAMIECDPFETLEDEDLYIEIDVDSIQAAQLPDERLNVNVEMSFALYRQADDGLVCDLSATHRLIYETDRSTQARIQALCTERALQDTWATWVAWLRTTTGQLGLDRVELPADLPPDMLEHAEQAFEWVQWDQVLDSRLAVRVR